jgi:hypothetical protein
VPKRGRIQLKTGYGEDVQIAVSAPKKRRPHACAWGPHTSRRRPTLPGSYPPSTIGPERLNFRVRNGNGCFPLGMTTGKTAKLNNSNGVPSFTRKRTGMYGQAARPISTGQLHASLRFHLPPINLVVYQGPLGALRPGTPNLGVGFPLRCIQRLSCPDTATRRCRWRDNRYTGGPYVLVLSY